MSNPRIRVHMSTKERCEEDRAGGALGDALFVASTFGTPAVFGFSFFGPLGAIAAPLLVAGVIKKFEAMSDEIH